MFEAYVVPPHSSFQGGLRNIMLCTNHGGTGVCGHKLKQSFLIFPTGMFTQLADLLLLSLRQFLEPTGCEIDIALLIVGNRD
jgi:hypothetical protein